jgi:hypothetical protein
MPPSLRKVHDHEGQGDDFAAFSLVLARKWTGKGARLSAPSFILETPNYDNSLRFVPRLQHPE